MSPEPSNCPVGPTELAGMQPESHVFPVGDVNAAAAAMKQALYDEQKRGTSKVPIPDMSEHTTNKVVNALEGIANELIAKRELAKSLPKDHGIAGWLRNRREPEKPVSAPRHFGR